MTSDVLAWLQNVVMDPKAPHHQWVVYDEKLRQAFESIQCLQHERDLLYRRCQMLGALHYGTCPVCSDEPDKKPCVACNDTGAIP